MRLCVGRVSGAYAWQCKRARVHLTAQIHMHTYLIEENSNDDVLENLRRVYACARAPGRHQVSAMHKLDGQRTRIQRHFTRPCHCDENNDKDA